jgi:hypothetical protein
MKSALLICVAASLLPFVAPVSAAEPRTEGIETAASGPVTDRRVRSREEMESAQTDGLGYSRGKRNGNDDWFEPMRFYDQREPSRTGTTPRTSTASGSRDETTASPDSEAAVSNSGQDNAPPQQSSRGNGGSGIVNGQGSKGSGHHGNGDEGGRGKGVVNAAGGASDNPGRGGNESGRGKGIVNAWGGSSIHSGRGGDDAPKGKGIVNAAGGAFGPQSGGSNAGKGSAPIRPAGAGIVTGAGTAATVSATTSVSRGIVNAAGGLPGSGGKGEGGGRGKH